MRQAVNNVVLTRVYASFLFLSLSACLYSYFKPGIVAPIYPEKKLKTALSRVNPGNLISSTHANLDKDTADRKLTPVYTYRYRDGSKVLSTMVRVKKRDEFKIETYGLLTKDIEQIYLKNPRFTDTVPFSLIGSLNEKNAIQTCIIPKTKKPEEVDIRLSSLVSSAENLHPQPFSLTNKFFGSKRHVDYTCLVLTYQTISKDQKLNLARWTTIVQQVQSSLLE